MADLSKVAAPNFQPDRVETSYEVTVVVEKVTTSRTVEPRTLLTGSTVVPRTEREQVVSVTRRDADLQDAATFAQTTLQLLFPRDER